MTPPLNPVPEMDHFSEQVNHLISAAKANDTSALMRIAVYHPRRENGTIPKLKVTGAKTVIARENGFAN